MKLPEYGPRTRDAHYKKFFDISEGAFEIYRAKLHKAKALDPLIFFWSRFGHCTESTSWSIRMLTSWESTLPAVALGRVRLEQVIVSSYLIHEKTTVALTPYLFHMHIDNYLHAKEAMQDPVLRTFLDAKSLEASRQVAIAAKKRLDPNYDGTVKSLNQSRWTKLDILSMARKRDAITKGYENISRYPLVAHYNAFYRDFSGLVHTLGLGISPQFLGMFRTGESAVGLMPQPFWSRYLILTLAAWDILNVFELLSVMQRDCESELKDLHGRWLECRDAYFSEKDSVKK